jgi:O-antigen ligase
VPDWAYLVLGGVALGLPNLVFSGFLFYDPLHLLKWMVTMVPVALLSVWCGLSIARRRWEDTGFRVDPLGALLLCLILWASLQPLLGGIKSMPTFVREWFAFSGLVAFYLVTYNVFRGEGQLRAFIWLGVVNGAINVLFAEVQTRMSVIPVPFILNAPGSYVGNTAQQEMFGLWTAMACLGGAYLHMSYSLEGRRGAARWLNLCLMGVNGWGLWNSTARGGIVSLMVGLFAMGLVSWRVLERGSIRRLGEAVLVLVVVLFLTFGAGKLGLSRAETLVVKASDVIENPGDLAGRIGIWRSSWEVFKFSPVKGVGLGQFKYHYLAGQRVMFDKYPDGKWQYTLWAHNEYLQWMGEFGLVGAALLAMAMGLWLWGFVRALMRGEELPRYVAWAAGMAFLVAFNALFSRPFHRVENVIWLAFALGASSRHLLPREVRFNRVNNPWLTRLFGGVWALLAILGLTYLVDGYIGDRNLLTASRVKDPEMKMVYINRSHGHLMTREEAEEQRGYYFLALGEYMRDPVLYRKGADILYGAFNARTDTKKLFDLIKAYGILRDKERVLELVHYLKPGTYKVHL